MIKKLPALFLLVSFLFIACPTDDPDGNKSGLGPRDGLSGQTAAGYVAKKGLSIGWNLGNTFDLNSMPAPTQKLMDGVKAAGFNVIRIPVSWTINSNQGLGGGMGGAPDYPIAADRLAKAAGAVDMAYNAGLVTIINSHHDGGSSWLPQAAQNAQNRQISIDRYTAIWAQIAAYFKDYGDWLIFEPFNEVRDGNNWDMPSDGLNGEMLKIIDEWNQAFVDAVRAAGGNNAQRFLIAKAYAAKPHRTREIAARLPNDPAPGKQMVSFHYYIPEAFSLNGTTFDWRPSRVVVMANDFSQISEAYAGKDIPIFIGECGATYQSNLSGAEAETANANRIMYLSALGEQAKRYGFIPVLWDNGEEARGPALNAIDPGANANANDPNGETFALFKRRIRHAPEAEWGQPVSGFAAQCIAAIVNAVK